MDARVQREKVGFCVLVVGKVGLQSLSVDSNRR